MTKTKTTHTPQLERKTLDMTELKALGTDVAPHGGIAGYASTFGTIDRVWDIVQPGAYKATIDDFVRDGFLGVGHDWTEPIGYILSAKEDARGLWIEAAFHSTDRAQAVRTAVNERLEAGKSVSMSIGYKAEKYSYDGDGNRLLEEVSLREVSVVTVPANPEATVSSAKSEPAPEPEPQTEPEVDVQDVVKRYVDLVNRLSSLR